MKHTLTSENADQLNVGKSLNPGESADDEGSGYLRENDSVEALPLPSGDRLVITGVNDSGLVTGVVFEAPDEVPDDDDSDYDGWTKDELEAEVHKRGLSVSEPRNKPQYVAALLADDAGDDSDVTP